MTDNNTPQNPPQYQPHQTVNITQAGNEPPRTNHLLHLVISLVTAGLWVPVWVIIRIARGR